MKIREWPTEVEAIDIQLRTLLERRAQLLRLASAPDDPRPVRTVNTHAVAHTRPRTSAPRDAQRPHPDAHLALGDLP